MSATETHTSEQIIALADEMLQMLLEAHESPEPASAG